MLLRFRVLALLLGALLAPAWNAAGASTLSGQGYALFTQYYKEDITFINTNGNRHLIPLSIAKTSNGQDGQPIVYSLMGDTLNVTLTMNNSGDVIESCVITLTAPPGMEYGNAVYNDFAISGYQSYALLMAMHTDPDPAKRYGLVTDVEAGILAGNGSYQRQLGVYTLTCTRQNNVAELRFEIKALQETPPPRPAVEEDTDILPSGEPEGEEEGGGML